MVEALDAMKRGAMALVMVSIIIAALALSLDAFDDDITQCDGTLTYNSTANNCYNASGDVIANSFTAEMNISQEGLQGVGNASSYLSTIGTLIGVSALVAVVMIAFYFVRR